MLGPKLVSSTRTAYALNKHQGISPARPRFLTYNITFCMSSVALATVSPTAFNFKVYISAQMQTEGAFHPLLLSSVFTASDDSSLSAVFAGLCFISGREKSPRDCLPPAYLDSVARQENHQRGAADRAHWRFSAELTVDECS